MDDYEQLGVFYLGRRHDVERRQTVDDLILFESRNLVTHGLAVGMTGSGKTGLCIDLIEEAAIDGIPSILIDPKGDLSNLLLAFPELSPGDFQPWVNEDDARKKGMSVEAFAVGQAEAWKKGLGAWGQSGERIRKLKNAAEFMIYTPGSSAGRQVSLLKSFSVPSQEILEEMEAVNDRAATTVAGLLGLAGIEADPVNNRDSVLLTNLLLHAWKENRDLDLGGLIHEIRQPSVTTFGVLDLESFYPSGERFALAMRLNNLLASPSFAAWMAGEPLDPGKLLWSPSGKPRVAIFSIAHLGEAERMFFVTLLLNQVLAWTRSQSGTSSLRALLYMDEIFGFFPPVANPPSKKPLLSLLKQGRAFGMGVVLATQNPVDLDYKGLANIGTWFIGRLQTDRDKARVLDGLEGAMTGRGISFERAETDRLISSLGSRVFLLHSVHSEGFELFESRWAMSYLRGPLSRGQIKTLMAQVAVETSSNTVADSAEHLPTSAQPVKQASSSRSVLPPKIQQFFGPVRGQGGPIVYVPRLVGAAAVRYSDFKLKIDSQEELVVAAEITDGPVPVDWEQSEELRIELQDFEKSPVEGAYAPLAAAAANPGNYDRWSREFASWISANRVLLLFKSEAAKMVSFPAEGEREFLIRVQQVLREQRDQASEKLRVKYAPKLAAIQERIRRAQAVRERESSQARRAKFDTVVSLGSTLLGAFLGRKVASAGNVGRAASTVRSAGRSVDQAGDVARAVETIEALEKQLADLDARFHEEVAATKAAFDARSNEVSRVQVRPRKSDVQVRLVALLWLPYLQNSEEAMTPAF